MVINSIWKAHFVNAQVKKEFTSLVYLHVADDHSLDQKKNQKDKKKEKKEVQRSEQSLLLVKA